MCVPITDIAGDENGAAFVGRAGVACSCTYVGTYEQTQPALEAMFDWLTRSGIRRAGPAREVYHRFGADQEGYELPGHVLAARSEQYVTEVQIPIELPGAQE